jgi:hypothetical protein
MNESRKFARALIFLCSVIMLSGTAHATLYWQADTNRGISVFAGLDLAPGTVSVAPDPLDEFGDVYKFFLPDTNSAFGKERCESSGTETPTGEFRPSYNTDYYVGWHAMWNPMPVDGSWVAMFQMHGYGVSGQGAPLVLRCVNGDGNLYMQMGANGIDTNFWQTPFHTNVWQTFVLHIFMSTNWTQGYVQIWYNGTPQTNTANGTTYFYGPTWDNVDGVWADSYNKFKWGVYRSGSLDGKGNATAYMSGAKIGSTYADVDPNGGGDFSIATGPSSQVVAPGGGTNFTVSIGALAGFSTNVSLSASGLPVGASANFSPATVTNSGSSTLAISTSGSIPVGNYPITILGTSGALAHSNTVTLVVSAFTLSATPPSGTLNAGTSTNIAVSVSTGPGFAGSVVYGISGLPAGTSANFNPTSLAQSGSSTLAVVTTSNAPSGTDPLTIWGTNGGVVVSATVALTINGVAANPGTLLWTAGGANGNWSTIINWTNPAAGGNGPPGAANSLLFTNSGVAAASALTSPGSGVVVPANINGTVDGNVSVSALTNYANAVNTSPNYQNLGIAGGAALTITGNLQVGGFGAYDFGANNTVNMSVSGAGATLQVNGTVSICQGSGSSGAHDATLDLSGLDNLQMTGSQIRLGVENITRSGGVLYLAKTNTLLLLTAGYVNTDGSGSPYSGNPAIYLGHNKTAVGNGAQLYLGISNSIAADYITVGRGDANDLMEFNPAFLASNPSVFISGASGGSSTVGVYVVGDNSPGEGSSTSATNDFTGGTVNALINYLCIGRGREGANDTTTSTGYLTFSHGNITANTLAIGFIYPNGSNSFANGIVNVNGDGTLAVMTNCTLAAKPGVGTGATTGTLNVNGGTVQVTNLAGGGGTSTVNLNSGTLDLQPSWATFSGTIANVSTINVGANGSGNAAVLNDAAQISTPNTLTIAANGTIAGNSVISAPSLVVNGTISPGNSGGGAGGITNSGSITLGAGGHYEVTVSDAVAGPVLGWSFLQSGGGISVLSTPANPFIIDVGTGGNPADNFNSTNNDDWVIATGGSFTGFATNEFVINSSQFQNPLGNGSFYLHTNGNSLVLSFTNNLATVMPVGVNLTLSGANLVFSGSNGIPFRQYYVLASTNLGLPLATWPVVSTNAFDASGDFSFTNPPNPNAPQTFYILRLQ